MMLLHNYLYANRLKQLHPVNKAMFLLLFIVFAFLSKSVGFLFFQGLTAVAFILFTVTIPKRILLKMLSLPFGFVLLGVLPLIVEKVSPQSLLTWHGWGISRYGLHQALFVFGRSFALTAAMYWFILVVSVQELVYLFRKIKLPAVFIDIILLVYRNIFLLLGVSEQIRQTQTCRMGYHGMRNSYRSLVSLLGQTLVLSFHRADQQYNSMMTRGYLGEWPTSVLPMSFSKRYAVVWIGFLLLFSVGMIWI